MINLSSRKVISLWLLGLMITSSVYAARDSVSEDGTLPITVEEKKGDIAALVKDGFIRRTGGYVQDSVEAALKERRLKLCETELKLAADLLTGLKGKELERIREEFFTKIDNAVAALLDMDVVILYFLICFNTGLFLSSSYDDIFEASCLNLLIKQFNPDDPIRIDLEQSLKDIIRKVPSKECLNQLNLNIPYFVQSKYPDIFNQNLAVQERIDAAGFGKFFSCISQNK